jgi:hypothetical protein
MSDFEFRGTDEERRTQAEVILVRMHRDLYGNGTPGILSRLERFITHHEAQESEREKQHAQNRDRLNIIIALLAAIAAYIAIVVSIHGLPKQAALPISGNTSLTSNATEARVPNVR